MKTQVISLRTATASDISGVSNLLAQSYGRLLKAYYPPSLQVMAIPLISKVNPALVAGGTYYLAEDRDDALVGGGGWTRSIKGSDVADIRHMVVHPDHVRQGIARRLMMGILSESRLAGVRRLDCLSTRMAEPFYAAMGFQRVSDVTIGLRPGIDFPVVRMVRDM